MKVGAITTFLEQWAPLSLQESYDNAGLLLGQHNWDCTGVLCCLDVTEEVIEEAVAKQANLIVAHHPLIFGGLKRINGNSTTERLVMKALQHQIAVYAIHTNLDNVLEGVNGRIAEVVGLTNCQVLQPLAHALKKLIVYVPFTHLENVRTALFEAGAGQVGKYSECSFSAPGEGTFKGGATTNPFVGQPGQRHTEKEARLEVLLPAYLESDALQALHATHPYEEVAFDVVTLENRHPGIGAGLVGQLSAPMEESEFLKQLSHLFQVPLVRHSPLCRRPIQKVAVCGGAGHFLIDNALKAEAQIFITSDLKYHDFFKAEGKILLADIGHFESERFTIELLQEELAKKFPTFAVLKTSVSTNPVNYLWHK
jgi:dinuclear metal center YbgI/SA1388 family protein